MDQQINVDPPAEAPKDARKATREQRSRCSCREHCLPNPTQFCGEVMLECGHGQSAALQLPVERLDEQTFTRLEEALQIIRMCLSAQGPITFSGKHYRLDRATMDLKPASGRVPEIGVAGHGPRMLRLTGRYGDGWYPTTVVSPQEYAAKLATGTNRGCRGTLLWGTPE